MSQLNMEIPKKRAVTTVKSEKNDLSTCNSSNTNSNEDNVTSRKINNNDTSFTLRKTKKTGNFSIMRCVRKGTSSKQAVYEKVKYKIYGCTLPFGVEEYNDNYIVNAIINNSSNINYNTICTLNRIIKTFVALKDNDIMCERYGLNGKKFFSFMKDIQQNEDSTKHTDNLERHNVRLYLRYGVKATHSKKVGEISYDQLKGRKCNLDIELGSMWVNSTTSMYGINIFITHINVLN